MGRVRILIMAEPDGLVEESSSKWDILRKLVDKSVVEVFK